MSNGKPYRPLKYKQLIDKNLVITILSENSISLSDLDDMPLLDRDYIYEELVKRQENIKKKLEQNSKNKLAKPYIAPKK